MLLTEREETAMSKQITRIVLTGGPAAGKTTLISRILKEFKTDDGWRVITIPETVTELISGFGIGPFAGCMSMDDFQYFVIGDQLHKEQLALRAAEEVPQDKILIVYDRAIFDDRAYVSQEQFIKVLASYGKTPEEIMAGYDAVLHLVSCAKGAEFAYNYGNAARYESVEDARRIDDNIINAWSAHPNFYEIDNSIDFEDKMKRAMSKLGQILGRTMPEAGKRKYLIEMPDLEYIRKAYSALCITMEQTYLIDTIEDSQRRIRKQKSGSSTLYFYTEKRRDSDGNEWVTERPISEKEYSSYLREADSSLSPVLKTKLRFTCNGLRNEIDVYPFSDRRAILFVFGTDEDIVPEGVKIIKEVTGVPEYKNRALAVLQSL